MCKSRGGTRETNRMRSEPIGSLAWLPDAWVHLAIGI